MAHETHHDTHHSQDESKTTTTSFRSAFWFVLLLSVLFIAAVNFVRVMGNDDEGHGNATEHTSPPHEPTTEATSGQYMEGETGVGKSAEHATEHPGAIADSVKAESHEGH